MFIVGVISLNIRWFDESGLQEKEKYFSAEYGRYEKFFDHIRCIPK